MAARLDAARLAEHGKLAVQDPGIQIERLGNTADIPAPGTAAVLSGEREADARQIEPVRVLRSQL